MFVKLTFNEHGKPGVSPITSVIYVCNTDINHLLSGLVGPAEVDVNLHHASVPNGIPKHTQVAGDQLHRLQWIVQHQLDGLVAVVAGRADTHRFNRGALLLCQTLVVLKS